MPLPTPVQRQREVVCLAATGHQVVLGTAGSGKTTMAILRAAQLSHAALPGGGRTLLLTYNKALVQFIRTLGAPELRNVTVEHFHKFARGYLSARGKMSGNAIMSRRDRAIAAAVNTVSGRYDPHAFFGRPTSFFASEITWLAQHGISSADDYGAADRAGRSEARLERVLRPFMWEIRDEYLAERERLGFMYDWDDLAAAVADELDRDTDERRYRHVVIDEGQDFSPQMLRVLAKTIPADGSLTFFGDVAQQIYGHRMSWRAAGLSPIRVWHFEQNYRNTSEIAALGLAIAGMDYYAGATDMVAPTAPTAAGPKPTLVTAATDLAETTLIRDQAVRLARTQSVVVLARTVRQMDAIRKILPTSAIALRDNDLRWIDGPSLYFGTYHSAKGLEFDAVMLPFLTESLFPDASFVSDFGVTEAAANDGRLLYVGVTRARTSLILSHCGPVTKLLPDRESLFTRVSV